jgi:hypothetical protein
VSDEHVRKMAEKMKLPEPENVVQFKEAQA